MATNAWGHGITTTTKPLRLTRGRVVTEHTINGTPFRAHLIENPYTGRVTLYRDGRPDETFRSVSDAMHSVAALAQCAAPSQR